MKNCLSDDAAAFLAQKQQLLKPSSLSLYSNILRIYILPYFRSEAQLCQAGIEEFISDKLAEGLSFSTIQICIVVLKMLIRQRWISQGLPMAEIKLRWSGPACNSEHISSLNRQQHKEFCAYLTSHMDSRNLGLLICLCTGMRQGEVIGLQWKDVDTEGRLIHVRKTVQRLYGGENSGERIIGLPKTSTSIRDVPITGKLMRILKAYKRMMHPETYIVSNDDVPAEARSYRAYYGRLTKKLGLPKVRFHGLRHSFATRCVESGCDYKTLSAILGHASIRTTMDLYVHPDNEQKRRCIEKMLRSL